MLTITKNVTLNGSSTFDERQAAVFAANIPEEDPMNMMTEIRQTNRALYWEHRKEVMDEYNAFQDEAVRIQQEMMNATK